MKKIMLTAGLLMFSTSAFACGSCSEEGMSEEASVPKQEVSVDASKIFNKKCKMCHKFDKKKVGPAFKDMNKDTDALIEAITNGRKVMPKFNKKLSEEEIKAMAEFIKSKQ